MSDDQKENRPLQDMEQIPENGENVEQKQDEGTSIVIALDASEECEHAVKCKCMGWGDSICT